MQKKHKVLIIITLILILFLIPLSIYLGSYYKASSNVSKYLKNSKTVKVIKEKQGYLFDGPSKDSILVFYPGAKVEYTAYAPIMHNLAKEGVDTYIVKMPFNIAFFKMNAIKTIKEKYKYDNWYLSGHSLGGVVASSDATKNDIEGLILLASYSTTKIKNNVLTIYGSNDGVLNIEKYKENKINIPNNKEIIITGGNHAYFGNYGKQKGDIEATITRNEQQTKTIIEIIDFIKNNKD